MNPSTDTREDIKPTVTRKYVDCPATQSVNVITIITMPGTDTVQYEMLLFGPHSPDIYCKFLIPDNATEEVKQAIQARNAAHDIHWNEQFRRRIEYTKSPESRIAYAKAYFKDTDSVVADRKPLQPSQEIVDPTLRTMKERVDELAKHVESSNLKDKDWIFPQNMADYWSGMVEERKDPVQGASSSSSSSLGDLGGGDDQGV